MIRIEEVLHKQFIAAGDTQYINNEGENATYSVNRKWLSNFAKLLIEEVVNKCAEEAEAKENPADYGTGEIWVDKKSILRVKEQINYT